MANNPVDKFQIFVTQLHNAGYDYDKIIYCMSIASDKRENEGCKELFNCWDMHLSKELMDQSLKYFNDMNINPSIGYNQFTSLVDPDDLDLEPTLYMYAQMEIYDTPDMLVLPLSLPSPIRPHNFVADNIQEVPIIVPPLKSQEKVRKSPCLTWYSGILDKMNRCSDEAEVTIFGRCLLDSVEYFLDPM